MISLGRLAASRMLVGSFAAAIAAGSLLLFAPFSTARSAAPMAAIDALFTATSAVCVTGLAVRDTGGELSLTGQLVVLLLIQVGGLGILTFSNAIFLARWHGLGLRERTIMSETVGLLPHLNPAYLLSRILVFTFACEAAGAAVLTLRFSRDFPLAQAAWLGIFHSVSAFCNAGFGLFSDSLMRYRTDLVVNLTIMALIVLGGLGFIVAADVLEFVRLPKSKAQRRLSFHSRVVLRTTALLIVGGWLVLFVLQALGPSNTPAGEMALESLFMSVTSRTAGFNTIDIALLTNPAILVVIVLMCIGGSPGSTAGGMKTTVAAILYALVRSRTANRPKIELLNRSIPHEVQGKALASMAGFVFVGLMATMLLEITESGYQAFAQTKAVFLPHLFEVFSALCTVGLSTGITAEISTPGKLVLIACMFIGRLGPVLVASSLVGVKPRIEYSYPEERVLIG